MPSRRPTSVLATVHDAGLRRCRQGRVRRPVRGRPGIRPRHRGRPGLPRHARGERPRRARAPSTAAARSGRARPSTPSTSPEACTTPCAGAPAASASTTTSAVGIRWLLDNGAERVAYVDLDVHHGDGVERIFWDDPRVLTISVHETGRALFPGTGWPTDIGGPGAEGERGQRRAAARASRRRLAARHPRDGACRSCAPSGPTCSSRSTGATPTSRTRWRTSPSPSTPSGPRPTPCTASPHEVCVGRWVALGGGGYEVVDVVPRTWTHLTAIAAHAPIKTTVGGPAGLARPRRAGARAARAAPDG